jgi:uncharacterized protein
MRDLDTNDPLASEAIAAIQRGDVRAVKELLRAQPDLINTRLVDERGARRTLLHYVADWPGHFPNAPQIVAILAAAGADLNAQVEGGVRGSAETALHGAASSNDVAVLDALLDAGADIEAPGAVFTGGSAMSDAVIFAQWDAARRLLDRGAKTTVWQASGLGLLAEVERHFSESPQEPQQITACLWHACRGGHLRAAQFLCERGADVNWLGFDNKTPLDVARQSGAADLIEWLEALGAKSARGGTAQA